MKKNSNKGMAMVTVLIAITFIGILASSLLYMSYMNYIAKAMRYSSTDNFYTSEYGLADLSTSLQNLAANAATVPEAFKAYKEQDINTASGVRHILTTNPSNPSVDCYDCLALEHLIQRASEESKIEIFTTYDTDGDNWADSKNYLMSDNSITFLGVRVRSTTAEGYVSTITTDIKIEFDSNKGKLSVNDFSVISDSPLEVDNKVVVIGGNVFLGARGTTDNVALRLKNISIVTMLSDRGIIYGNIVVEKGCTLVITGDIAVYGKVTVENGGSLICTGNLTHKEDLDIKNGAVLKGIEESHAAVSMNEIKCNDSEGNTLPDGHIASAIFSPVYVKSQNGSSWNKLTIDKLFGSTLGQLSSGKAQFKGNNGSDDSISTWIGLTHPCNSTLSSLVLNANDVSTGLELRGESTNNRIHSTIISSSKVVCKGEHATLYLSCLSDEEYDKARNILLYGSGQIMGDNYSFQGGDLGNTITFPVSGADEYIVSVADPTLGTKGRKVYCKMNGSTNYNYIPSGYFIAENADSILADAFSVAGGAGDPKNSTVSYFNWIKE